MNDSKIKIGYQGIEGSFSEQAAKEFAKRESEIDKNVEFVPLVSSINVVKELKNGNIKFGVLAVENSTAGIVSETSEALGTIEYTLISEFMLPIHHCVFIKPEVEISKIKYIASHEQAISQTKKTRKKLMENVESIEVEDTALAAKQLAEGTINSNTAVICSKNAGELFGLKLVYENIEDNADNATHFIAIEQQGSYCC